MSSFHYPDYAIPAVKFMAQKAYKSDEKGKMLSGCVVRHLILPLAAYDSVKVVEFVATLPNSVRFSLMSQYTPMNAGEKFPELNRRITRREYSLALGAVERCGLKNVFLQDFASSDASFIPDWDY